MIINLHTLTVQEYREVSIKDGFWTFSENYFAVIGSYGQIAVYSRKTQMRLHSISYDGKHGIQIDGYTVHERFALMPSGKKIEGLNNQIRLFENKLCFVVKERVTTSSSCLAVFDLETKKFTVYVVDVNFGLRIIGAANSYIYLLSKANGSSMISTIDLRSRENECIVRCEGADNLNKILRISDQYIIGWKKAFHNYDIFAVELSSRTIKSIPYAIKDKRGLIEFINNISASKPIGCIINHSTLYCFHKELGAVYKCNLAESIPTMITLNP